GIDRPRSRLVSLLCALFELPARELGLAQERAAGPIESGGAVDDEPARRQFVEKVAELLSTAKEPAEFPKPGYDPLERILHTLSRRGRLDFETVAHLERTTVALEKLQPT